MTTLSKRTKANKKAVDSNKSYDVMAGLEILKKCATAKFTETVEAIVVLGIDPKRNQNVRAATTLPHGSGKTVRVAVFAQGDRATAALEAGADVVGMDDLAADMKAGNLNYDVVIAAPDAMRVVGQLGQVLGPRGLMPNPKVGTVTPDVATAVRSAKGGQIRYRNDKAGILHCIIGSAKFEANQLKENLDALLADVIKAKPTSSKGTYIKKVYLSSTMGPGISLDLSSLKV
jgi:large subunit ribosomal protein L1